MTLSKRDQILGVIITLFVITLFLLYTIGSFVGFNDRGLLILSIPVLLIIAASIFTVRNYWKANQPGAINYLNVGIQRHLLGLFMITYGLPKLFGGFFDYQLFALDSKMVDASEFQLAWYFYGKNRWQELFSGIMEFVPGIMLLWRRTYYAGAVLLLPVSAQVFILNFFFQIGGVTFPAACVLLACNLYILYSEKENIIRFIKSLNFAPMALSGKGRIVVMIGKWGVILLAIILIGGQSKRAFFKSDFQERYQNLVGMYTLEEMKKNNADYSPTNESRYYKDLYIEKQSRWNILRRFNNKTDACIIELGTSSDSITLFINKSGIGDSPDIKDEETVLRGIFKLDTAALTIHGVQLGDTLHLTYRRQKLKPKGWFW